MKIIIEKLTTHEDFINEEIKSFLEKNKASYLLKSKNSFFNQIKFLKDLNSEEEEAFNFFKNKCLLELRSRNKSSNQGIEEFSSFKDIKSIFFKKNNIYHHHLINQKTYEQKYFFNSRGDKIYLPNTKLTIKDHIEKLYHTSGLCLHYQKNVLEEEIHYKILFISKHPISKDWDNAKNFIEKNHILSEKNIEI